MIKKPFFVLCFLCLPYMLNAQTEIDSLKRVIETTKQDTTKVHAYLQFFFTNMFYDDLPSVIDYSHKARMLSKKIDFKKGLASSHNNLGYIYRTKSENDSAFYHYNRAISVAEPVSFYKGVTDAHIGLGNTYNQLGEWDDAVKQFETVIDLARKEGDSVQIGSAHNNIGNTYLNQSRYELALPNYQKAVELGNESISSVAMINIAVVHNQMGNTALARDYFRESIKKAEAANRKGHLAFITRSLGILEKKEGNYDKALEYYNKAYETYEALSDDFSQAEIIQNMGNVYLELKDYNKAIEHYNRSLQIQETINYPLGACYNHLYIGTALQALGRLNEAAMKLLQAESCAKELKVVGIQTDAAETMSLIKAELGDYKAALEYQKQFKTLSDSLKTISSNEKIAELDTKFQTAQKEQEIELLSAENEISKLRIQKQDNLRNFLIIAAILMVILLVVIYNRYALKLKANKKLQELDDIKNSFYTNISHEFRTPLTLILSPLDNILKLNIEKEVADNASLAQRNANRLLQLTNQMLDLSKLEAGKMQLQVAEQDVSTFFQLVYASFESLAESKNIEFIKDFNFTTHSVYFDGDALQKILYNLLSNAFKFTPHNGKVVFMTTIKKSMLKCEIRDTGKGLSIAELNSVFKRFEQGHQANGISETGTGIGLTLTKELVELHKGTLNVESQVEKGSSFMLRIPVSKQLYQNVIEHKPIDNGIEPIFEKPLSIAMDEVNAQSNKPIALVVEDNGELRNYLANLLKQDYSVTTAINGKEGIEMAMELIPDVIISDWMMPEMTGDILCEKLKTDEKTSHIPIILLTAKADKSSKLEGLTLGADDYINKPFDNKELLIRVKNLIENRKILSEKYGEKLLIEPSKVNLPDPDKAFIKKAIATVEAHISDDTFTSEDFQKEMGLSRMQLYRKLKALTDSSASEFIRNLRLQRASDLLSQNHLQVSEIAYQCGFTNLSYFGQCFKEKYGVPPSQFQSK